MAVLSRSSEPLVPAAAVSLVKYNSTTSLCDYWCQCENIDKGLALPGAEHSCKYTVAVITHREIDAQENQAGGLATYVLAAPGNSSSISGPLLPHPHNEELAAQTLRLCHSARVSGSKSKDRTTSLQQPLSPVCPHSLALTRGKCLAAAPNEPCSPALPALPAHSNAPASWVLSWKPFY